MNLILLTPDELTETGTACLEGRRARHVLDILGGEKGKTLKVGVLDGAKGTGTIEAIENESVMLRCRFDCEIPPAPRVDLLLALPRPLVMKRLWAPLASLGVGHIVLTNAEKVERDYFGTHWLKPSNYEPLLIEGLEQAGDTRLPKVTLIRRLKPFLEDELDSLFPDSKRLIAEPGDGTAVGQVRLREGQRVLMAVGPEGGWTDFELEMFERHGFSPVTMGWRTLRLDTACIALLGVVNAL